MSKPDTVKLAQQGPVAVITLSRPDAMNSFNTQLRLDLLAAFTTAARDDAVRAVVLTGEGRAFSAGADLKEGAVAGRPVDRQLQEEYRPVFDCIAGMRQPVIAAVNGSAAGIGMSYALACDLMIMAEDAFLLSPFSTISLVPDGGMNWMLVQQLGYRVAFQLSVEAERIGAARCVELGIANRTASQDSLLDEAIAWAQALAERAPLSIAATKRAMRHAVAHDWASTFDLEAALQRTLRESKDCEEGVRAFFEKRKPEFTGR